MVSAELTARRLAGVVRLQVSADMPEPLKTWIAEQRVTDPADILREGFVELIQRERAHCRAGRSCGIRAKMNQLQDPQIIRELYLTSQAGVPITLNVRGLCCLRAVVPE
jgi:polyphosphate kinase